MPSLSEDSRRTARMRSACWLTAGWAGSGSCSSSELLLLELLDAVFRLFVGLVLRDPAVQRVAPRCPRTPRSSPPQVVLQGLLAPAVPPAPGGGSQVFSSAPFLSARPASAASGCQGCSFSSTPRLSSGTLAGAFPTRLAPSCGAGPPALGCHLPALVRGTSGDGWSRSLLLGARSKQLRPPNLATGRLGLASPDPRPRTASYYAGPTPGRPAARFPLASSSAGLVRWFPTSSETASGLDSSLLLRPSCGTF